MADESRYADVLRQMLDHGHWLALHLNGSFYADKPPLYFWLCAAVSSLTGTITPRACLFVTGTASAAGIATCFVFARDLFGLRTACFSAAAMLGSLLFLSTAQIVRMDALMALFVALAILMFYRWTRDGSRYRLVLCHLFIGLAILTKGPLALAFAFLPPVAWLIQNRRWRLLRGFLNPLCLLISLTVGGGWLVAAWFLGHQDLVRSIFVDQLAGRSVGSHAIHSEPVYFYALVLLPILLPWAPFLPRAVRQSFGRRDNRWWLLLWWFSIGFAVISGVSGKLYLYLLPLLTPVAILLGQAAATVIDAKPSRAFRTEAVIASLLTLLPAALAPFLLRYAPHAPVLDLGLLAAICMPLAALACFAAVTCSARTILTTLFVSTGVLSALLCLYIAPQIDTFCSGRQLGQSVGSYARAGRPVATVGVTRGIINFYADADTPEVGRDELAAFLADPAAIAVMRGKHLARSEAALARAGASVLASYETVMGRLVIVGHAALDGTRTPDGTLQ